ncbi:MAG: aminopeptidase N [Pseudomonadota bacterium]
MKDGQPAAIQLKDYKVPPFLIDSTDLHVEINEDQTLVTSTLRIRRNPDAAAADTRDLVLDGGEGLDTREVALDDRALLSNEFRIEDASLTLFDVPDNFVLKTQTAIKPQENTALEGLYKSGDMFCTQCEAEGFRHITWYLDRPDVMSVYRTTISADQARYPVLLSNGNKVAQGESDGRHWATWEDPFMKPAYLFALVAGNLEYIEDRFVTMSGREVTLQIFTEAHNIDKLDHAMVSLKHAMKWDEEVYGREYDLDIFMIVAVESFNMGAMENKGLNIFNTSCVLARPDTTTDAGYQRVESVVAHEYFHNWSGNRVTCRDWFQLSLKEGFTVFRDQAFSADMGSPAVCRVNDVALLRAAQFPEDAGPMAHPIRPDSYIEINNFYTATVYEKGAEVVRMCHTLLGPERFRLGSDLYFERHDGQAVTTEDFVSAMEDASGVDLTQFRHWYSQAGTPVLAVTSDFDEEAGTFTLDVTQHCPPTPGQEVKLPFHLPLAVGLVGEDGQDLPLVVEAGDVACVRNEKGEFTTVLNVTRERQQFRFSGLAARPVPSILRHFSAPVKLDYSYSRDDLVFLMSHDSDGFNRWEAGQRLAIDVIQEVIGQQERGEKCVVDPRLVQAFDTILTQAVTHHSDGQIDKAMIADMLVLPSEQYLVELTETADIDAIVAARETVRGEIARALTGVLLSVYKLNRADKPYAAVAADIAQRALRNVTLAYLMAPEDTEMVALCAAQFDASDNMTDTSAALRAMVNASAPDAAAQRERMLTEFYNRWVNEALVIDMWFQIQAGSPRPGAVDRVTALMQHEAYRLTNPNRARALIGPFTANLANFHAQDGSGYRFLAERIIELNLINPQLAARLMSPLTRWRRFDSARQDLMRGELQRILEVPDLSRDVFEIASKSA